MKKELESEKIKEAYEKAQAIFIAVDCIIFGFKDSKLQVLLMERDTIDGQVYYGLPFNMVKKDQSVDASAREAISNHTGLSSIFLDQLRSFGDVDRDPVARTVSVNYYALARLSDCDPEILKKVKAKWFLVNKLPKLLFDHEKMIKNAREELKILVQYKPIGKQLLPKKFTMTMLRTLYEVVLERKIDRRNFSRKIIALNLLDKSSEKDKKSSKRGAHLHSFNDEVYEDLLEKGLKLEM